MTNRRSFIKYVSGTGFVCFAVGPGGARHAVAEPLPGGVLDPGVICKYQIPLSVPPVMSRAGKRKARDRYGAPWDAGRRPGSDGEEIKDMRTGASALLPGPAPSPGDMPGTTYFTLPLVVQDRCFHTDGSLFQHDMRALFAGIGGANAADIDVFGNAMLVNGLPWPFQVVEQRRYRLRLLNRCQARFLFLDFAAIAGVEVWQIGNQGGYLVAPVDITGHHNNRVLLGPTERAEVIVDFSHVQAGQHLLRNVGPDEPFSGGTPDLDFPAADPGSSGQVLQFRVVAATAADPTTPPQFLRLPAAVSPQMTVTRRLARLEEMSMVCPDGPNEALLGEEDGAREIGPAEWSASRWDGRELADLIGAVLEVWA